MAFGRWDDNPLMAALRGRGTTAQAIPFDSSGDFDLVGDREPGPPGENGPVSPGPAGYNAPAGTPPAIELLRRIQQASKRGLLEGREGVEQLRGPGGSLLAAATTHGPRKGQRPVGYKLPNGDIANVYYDRRGKRQVQVFTPGG